MKLILADDDGTILETWDTKDFDKGDPEEFIARQAFISIEPHVQGEAGERLRKELE